MQVCFTVDYNLAENAFSLAKELKFTLEKVNQIPEVISEEIYNEDIAKIKEGIESLKNFIVFNEINYFTDFYQKVFNTLKSILEFLQKKSPNPGLMNSTTILCAILENYLKEVQLTNENSDYLQSISKLINDGKIILFNEYNR